MDSLAMMLSPAFEATFDYFELQIAWRKKPIRHMQPVAVNRVESVRNYVVVSSDETPLKVLSVASTGVFESL